MLFAPSAKKRVLLEELSTASDDARTLRRAQALLWLAEGESVEEVAERLRVSRQSIYNWVARFQAPVPFTLRQRLADGVRNGRPRTVHGIIDPLIAAVIEEDPRELGYQATVWTAGLLQHYLQAEYQLTVGRRSVGAAIARLRLRWKRPRHHLARRSPTWRQAKGGSNMGCKGGVGRLS
jgi:transposase